MLAGGAWLVAVAGGFAAQPTGQPAGDILFARRVWPMFEEKCLACHGRDEAKIKGGFVLRTREDLMLGGDSARPAVIPGKPEESPLYKAISRHDDDWKPMPPKDNDRLASEQIAYVREWIAAGAPWPDAARMAELLKQPDPWAYADGVAVPTSGGLSADWTNRKYKPENLWAFQPLRKPGIPGGAGSPSRPEFQPAGAAETQAASEKQPHPNPIDAFINAKLAEAKLAPAPPADRRTLLRRATFDLLGLPPTPEETQAFLVDPADDAAAFTKVVERLLASPHYGEKWGQHWLDVTRYADSSGFANDYARGPAWRYRDYVIRAFNQDKPYDQFIREQIAGDELAAAAGAADSPAVSEMLIATGFLRTGPWELTGMEVAKVARQKYLDDVTDSVGQVFLAQPLQCARCHDHKFDPIPTRDYYSFQAIFATTQFADRPAAFLPTENTAGFEEKKYLLQRQEHYRTILKRLDAKSLAAARAWLTEHQIDPAPFEQAAKQITGSGKSNKRGNDAGYAEVRQVLMRQGIPEDQIPPKLAGFTPEDYGIERIARKGLTRIRWELDRYEAIAFAVYDGGTPEMKTVDAPLRMPSDPMTSGEVEQTCILTGGDPFANGVKVEPHPLSAVSNLAKMESAHCAVPPEISGRRRALADWISSPDNPLTPRVIVNRIWGWHFGQPLAGNPNNFGATGKKPTHPELLDWLAATFVHGEAEAGVKPWSIKSLHRLIMASEAYRRSPALPGNQSSVIGSQSNPKPLNTDALITDYGIFKPRRLTAEELRDTMLAVSGELNPALGGIPVRPEMNREAALQPRQVMGTFAEAWQPSPKPEQRNRRAIYALRIRGQTDPLLDVFNAPNADLSCERRDESTVTPQALALFNGAATMDRAVALAARVIREAPGGQDAAIRRLFDLVYGRAPSEAELARCRAHWDKMTARHRATTIASPPPPREVVREAVEENTGEKFKFVEPLEAAADFVPGLKLADVPVETRGLAELCLVLLNSNEFAFVY